MVINTSVLNPSAQFFDELGKDCLVNVSRREGGRTGVGSQIGPIDGEAGYFC